MQAQLEAEREAFRLREAELSRQLALTRASPPPSEPDAEDSHLATSQVSPPASDRASRSFALTDTLELIIDGQVMARAYRDEVRRPLDRVSAQASRVTLRLIFDDPRHADFDIDLWVAGDDLKRPNASPATAVQEANSWLARTDAILRRARPRPKVATPPPPPAPTPAQSNPDQPPLPFAQPDEIDELDDGPPF